MIVQVSAQRQVISDREIEIFVDQNNNLFFSTSVCEAEETFNNNLSVGKMYYQNGDTAFFFASINENVLKLKGYSFKPLGELNQENCEDYDAIMEGIKPLGYKIISS